MGRRGALRPSPPSTRGVGTPARASNRKDLSPFLWGHQAREVLGHQLPQDLGDARQLGLVTAELGLADEACQLDRVLPRTLVEPTQVLGQLLGEGHAGPQAAPPPAAGGRGQPPTRTEQQEAEVLGLGFLQGQRARRGGQRPAVLLWTQWPLHSRPFRTRPVPSGCVPPRSCGCWHRRWPARGPQGPSSLQGGCGGVRVPPEPPGTWW